MRTVVLIGILLSLVTAAYGADERCLSCHGAAKQAGYEAAQLVDTTHLAGSIHATLTCNDCHQINPDKRHKDDRAVFCARCHQSEAEGFNKSPHVAGRSSGIDRLPTCITCHGGHDILAHTDSASRTNSRNSVTLCTSCHEDEALTQSVTGLPPSSRIKAYENSIHGQALIVRGNQDAPACIDCHGSHSSLASDDPDSPVYKTHVAATCGRCHAEISEHYQESVHGTSLAAGIMDSPTCTNCHGEHSILPQTDPESRTFSTNVSKTCSDCHASEKVVAKFGLKADRIQTFKESFHGAAGALGDIRVANCASCHGVHDIFPQSDARSTIHPAKVATTCGSCHEGLPAEFAQGAVHTSAVQQDSGGEYWVRKFYIWFISILILAFVVYRVLEYKRRVKRVG